MGAMTEERTFEQELREHLDDDSLRELAEHGADAGWPGITYYSDTKTMYEAHEAEIWAALEEDADSMGLDHPLALIATFGGAKDVGDGTQFANLLCWYMAERVARAFADGEE